MTKETPSMQEVSEREFVVEHTIRSSPKRIFEAYTKPDLIAQWWAQPGLTVRIDEMDVRPGGKWRFAHVASDGEDTLMHGEYKDVDPVTRLSYTYNHGEGNANEILAIVDLKSVNDATLVTLTNRFQSREQRDMMLSYGAEAGAKAALKSLEALVRST